MDNEKYIDYFKIKEYVTKDGKQTYRTKYYIECSYCSKGRTFTSRNKAIEYLNSFYIEHSSYGDGFELLCDKCV